MFPAEPVPEKIGAYTVLKYFGRSGAADVYSARADGPLGFQRVVTLKLVRFAIDDDARVAEELAREASICSRLNHPAIIRVHDFFEYERRLVLVTEQAEGTTLDRVLSHIARRKQKLSDGAIFHIGTQIAAALAHAHACADDEGNATPVIHRNLHPENVLVSWDGHVRLSGFGLGKILGRTPDSVLGSTKGTPGFNAPEVVRGERATVRSDVYGFGILLWSLLTDKEPPEDGARPEKLGLTRPDLPRELVAAVEAALEPSPDKRRITCAEMAQWLGKLVKPDHGREELRQKVLPLRTLRSPVQKPEGARPAGKAKPTRRRPSVMGMRPVTSRQPFAPSSFPSPPLSEAPDPGRNLEMPRYKAQQTFREANTARQPVHDIDPDSAPTGVRAQPPPSTRAPRSAPAPAQARRSNGPSVTGTGSFGLRIPPPPPLPSETPSHSQGLRPSHDKGVKSATARASTPPAKNGRPATPSARPTMAAPAGFTSPTASTPPAGVRASMRAANGAAHESPKTPTLTSMPAVRATGESARPRSGAPIALLAEEPCEEPVDLHGFYEYGNEGSVGLALSAPSRPPTFGTRPPGARVTAELAALAEQGIVGFPQFQQPAPAPAIPPFLQVMLACLTAALVVAMGLLWLSRPNNGLPTDPPTVVVATTPPPTSAAVTPAPTTQPAPSPIATQPPRSTQEPAAKPAAADDPRTANAASMPETQGYLTVRGPSGMEVYLNGIRRGPTHEPLLVACGRFFLRLGQPNPGRYPTWLGKGETVVIPCQRATVFTADPNDISPQSQPNGVVTPRPRSFGL